MTKWILIATVLCVSGTTVFAQTLPGDVRRLLGTPIDILQSAVFAANVASYRDNCGGPPERDGDAEAVMRLESGSLNPADRRKYKGASLHWYNSNKSTLASLDSTARKGFCRGLNSAVLHHVTEFVRAHPALFGKK